MGQIQSKCLGCTDRYPGCHAKCENYLTFRKELDEHNESLRKARELEGQADAFRRTQIQKVKRNMRNKK